MAPQFMVLLGLSSIVLVFLFGCNILVVCYQKQVIRDEGHKTRQHHKRDKFHSCTDQRIEQAAHERQNANQNCISVLACLRNNDNLFHFVQADTVRY